MASISKKEDALLLSRVHDMVELCRLRQRARFVGFLDERQRALVESAVLKTGICCRFEGGYEQAGRTMLGVFPGDAPEEWERFPLCALGIVCRKGVGLTHRDVLGALLGAGVRRESVGDILCSEGLSVAFVAEELAPFLTEQVTKIGREGVRLVPYYDGPLPQAYRLEPIQTTVASARLDCVVAALCHLSREEAGRRIREGLVSIHHIECESVSKAVEQGDILSVRGIGRFRIEDLETRTRKGRYGLRAGKYS